MSDGEAELRVLLAHPAFPFAVGQKMRGGDVDEALAMIGSYQNANECRFTYRFEYSSDSDYRRGRQRFDRVFYPGGEVELTR